MKFKDLNGKVRDGKYIKKMSDQHVIETIENENKVIYGVNDKDVIGLGDVINEYEQCERNNR